VGWYLEAAAKRPLLDDAIRLSVRGAQDLPTGTEAATAHTNRCSAEHVKNWVCGHGLLNPSHDQGG